MSANAPTTVWLSRLPLPPRPRQGQTESSEGQTCPRVPLAGSCLLAQTRSLCGLRGRRVGWLQEEGRCWEPQFCAPRAPQDSGPLSFLLCLPLLLGVGDPGSSLLGAYSRYREGPPCDPSPLWKALPGLGKVGAGHGGHTTWADSRSSGSRFLPVTAGFFHSSAAASSSRAVT